MTNPRSAKAEPAPVFIKCKNPRCDSIQMVELPYKQGVRLYQCIKCKRAVPISVGGKMDLRQL